jgi:[acyl-carrier-protein] S-malonyltransferase
MLSFIFPGQGSQKVGMGRALAERFPIVRDTYAEADAALGEALSRLCFEGPEDRLVLTENTQPAILATSIAIFRLLESRGVRPAFVAGHSLGEYSANVAAGTFAMADALRIVRRRGQYMQEAVPVGEGAMAAILGLDEEAVAAACDESRAELNGRVVGPANLNAPGQVVIAGHQDAVARAGERAKARGAKRVIALNVSAPFHCALMAPAQTRLTPELQAIPSSEPRVAIVANVDAQPKRTKAEAIDALIRQVAAPVRWEAVVRRLASEGVHTYVEVGPGTVLAGLVRKIDRDARVVSVEDEKGLSELESAHAGSASAPRES